MRYYFAGGRVRTLMGLSRLCLGMALCGTAYAQDQAGAPKPDAIQNLPEVLVTGKSSLDVDIARSPNDIQPYVVFDSEQIAKSGAQNISSFLQTYLPMDAQQNTSSQLGPTVTPEGRIDLRGLGANQTLILVDGHRLPSISNGDSFGQPNIDGIPISQIERIEILPTTASGIYGGGATGGVINIILKRHYSGIDLNAGYGNTFDGAVSQHSFGISGGFSMEDGRTRVMYSASHADAGVLLSSKRDFTRREAQQQLRNDPTDPSVLMGGANICSTVDGVTCSTQPLQLKSGASLSSQFTSVPGNYTGAASDGGAALAANAGQLQFNKTALPIWSAPETTTFTLNPRHDFTRDIEAYLDFAYDYSKTALTMPTQMLEYVPASAAVNPFQQDVLSYLTVPSDLIQKQVVKNIRANVGSIVRLPFQWSAVLDYGWARSTTSSTNSTVLGANSPTADQALQGAVFRDIVASPLSNPDSLFSFFKQNGEAGTTLRTLSLRMSGPVVELPGGKLTATVLFEQRNEASLNSVSSSDIGGTSAFFWTPAAHRKVDAQYLEVRAPVISPSNATPLVNRLELMASVRRDDYKTDYYGSAIPIDSASGPFDPQVPSTNSFGSTSHTLGFRYAPTPDVMLRASLGTGFLPPDLGQIRAEPPALFSSFLISMLDLRDPALGYSLIPGPLTVLGGGSPSLKPEQSRSTSVGLILTPRILPGLRISVDETNIHKTNEITTLPLSYIIDNEASLPGRVVRGPGSGGQLGPITQIDDTTINLASSHLRALDIQAEYSTTSAASGEWRFYAAATQTKELSHRVEPTAPSVDRSGFSDGPLKWRGNLGIDWSKGDWSAGWNAQYYDSYRVCQSVLSDFSCNQWETWQGASKVPSQIYHDVYVSYSFSTVSGILSGTDIRFSVNNVFNNQGATISSGIASAVGPTSYTDPRLRRFMLSLHKHF